MGELSVIQIVIVLVIALLVFGPKRLPEMGRQLGRGLRELRRHASSVTEDLSRAIDEEDPAAEAPSARTPPAPPPVDSDADLLAGVVVGPEEPAAADASDSDDDLLADVVVPGDQSSPDRPA